MEVRLSEILASPKRREVVREQAAEPGSVYVFVPAHGESRVVAVQQPLTRMWAEDLGLAVLLADFNCDQSSLWKPMRELHSLNSFTRGALVRREGNIDVLNAASATVHKVALWMEYASREHDVVAADLSPASEEVALEVMHVATSIFIVSDSDRNSLALARDKAAWMRTHGMKDLCALLLRAAPGGLRPDVAEDFTGIPVCSLIDTPQQIRRLAAWLTLDREPHTAAAAC